DCDAFNRGDFGKMADRVERFLKKGSQVYLEGRLKLDQWDDKTTGQKRSKLKVIVETMELLDGRPQGDEGMGGSREPIPMPRAIAERPPGNGSGDSGPPDEPPADSGGASGDNIPF